MKKLCPIRLILTGRGGPQTLVYGLLRPAKGPPRHRVTIAQERILKEQSALQPLSSPGASKRTYFFWETKKKLQLLTLEDNTRGNPGRELYGPDRGRGGVFKEHTGPSIYKAQV